MRNRDESRGTLPGVSKRSGDDTDTTSAVNAMAAFGAVIVLGLLAIGVFVSDSPREWTKDHLAVSVVTTELVVALILTTTMAMLWRHQGQIGRAAAFVLGSFATLIVLGTVLVFLPEVGSLSPSAAW